MSQSEQEALIEEAERQSAEIAKLQDTAGEEIAAILTAALLAALPSITRAYRRYTEALRPPEPGTSYQLPIGTGARAAARRRAVEEEIQRFARDVDLDAIGASVRATLEQAAEIGANAATVLGTVGDVVIDPLATPLAAMDARVAAITGRITAELAQFQSIMSQVVFDSAAQGFPGRRLERVIIEAFQGQQLEDGTVVSRGLIQRAMFTVETEVSVVSLERQMETIRAAGQQYVRWVTAQDEKVCPFCTSRHGRIYLSDRITIPAHMRCRCMAVPVPMPAPDAATDEEFWREEYDRTVAAYARANDLTVDEAAARLRTYQNRPTQAERLRYPGVEDAPPPIWNPLA